MDDSMKGLGEEVGGILDAWDVMNIDESAVDAVAYEM
jgi:hypothetical protein